MNKLFPLFLLVLFFFLIVLGGVASIAIDRILELAAPWSTN